MSRGRHSKAHAKGGGLATLLALAVAGGAVGVASAQPTSRLLRYSVVGLAVLSSFQLLMMARAQRTSSRAMARAEERLRTLELRSREEGEQLHRRVIEGVAREGELRRSVETLVDEISRLRASLEAFVPVAVPVAPTAPALPPVPVAPAEVAPAEPYTTVEVPLIQRVFAAQEAVAPEPAGLPAEPGFATGPAEPFAPAASFEVVTPAAPVEDTPWPAPVRPAAPAPAAGELWRAPSRPEYVPAPPPPATPGTSWVVREIQLDGEPGAALTMRILDLTTPAEPPSEAAPGTSAELPAGEESAVGWARFARPA